MKRNAVEWAVLAVSLASIAILVGVLVMEGLRESTPPDPSVELHHAEARQGTLGWIVPATISNLGDDAAEAVIFEAEATVNGQPETSELEVAFLPAGSSVELAFSFSGQPTGDIAVRLVGYRVP